ncbi:MAG: hypothetical protein U9R42_05600 [Bacteroidota bacterium]|nr:hypothetical protein [Bacteroidota bacterium]
MDSENLIYIFFIIVSIIASISKGIKKSKSKKAITQQAKSVDYPIETTTATENNAPNNWYEKTKETINSYESEFEDLFIDNEQEKIEAEEKKQKEILEQKQKDLERIKKRTEHLKKSLFSTYETNNTKRCILIQSV